MEAPNFLVGIMTVYVKRNVMHSSRPTEKLRVLHLAITGDCRYHEATPLQPIMIKFIFKVQRTLQFNRSKVKKKFIKQDELVSAPN